MQIIPSLLTDDQLIYINSLDELQGVCEMVQIDIADGIFVPEKTIDNNDLTNLHIGTLQMELHLMVDQPCITLTQWHSNPHIRRVYIHAECAELSQKTLELIREHGWQVGIALKPQTPISVLESYIEQIDAVLFLGVEPGGQGRPFQREVLEKIKTFKQMHPTIFCALDGGVNETTLSEIVKTGVDAVCPGSAVFGNERTPAENIERMRAMIK
jgi:ribulose-phosphate 3-epimerase